MGIFDRKPNFNPNLVDNYENKIMAETKQEPEIQEQQQEPSPFDMMKYNQFSNVPDMPINQNTNMAESLLSDDTVPSEIVEKYWYVFHRDNILTFLDKERKTAKMLAIDIMKIDMLNCTPYYDYNFDKEYELAIIRNVFETKLDRALGITTNIKNERTTLQSQFSEVKNISEMKQGEVTSHGFFKKLLGRR
jgi:hypothetical protein